ncbi:MAG: hypothetical protein ACFFCW_31085 [Candidatus Hodarchaeota archaeon]
MSVIYWRTGLRSRARTLRFRNALLVGFPGTNIKEFWVTILSEAKLEQIQCLSPEGAVWERSSAEHVLYTVRRTLEWSNKGICQS